MSDRMYLRLNNNLHDAVRDGLAQDEPAVVADGVLPHAAVLRRDLFLLRAGVPVPAVHLQVQHPVLLLGHRWGIARAALAAAAG